MIKVELAVVTVRKAPVPFVVAGCGIKEMEVNAAVAPQSTSGAVVFDAGAPTDMWLR